MVMLVTRMAVRIFVTNLDELFLGDLPVLVLVHFLECFEHNDYEDDKLIMDYVHAGENCSTALFINKALSENSAPT